VTDELKGPALLLAVLAGVFDFVPVLGFICSSVPAVLLGLSVSPAVGLAVAAVYAGYHLAENYYIGPKVYGNRLKLSNLAVIIAFAVGAEIGGVGGAAGAPPGGALSRHRARLAEGVSRPGRRRNPPPPARRPLP
jgi:predicted PurR-regulated permease PerM